MKHYFSLILFSLIAVSWAGSPERLPDGRLTFKLTETSPLGEHQMHIQCFAFNKESNTDLMEALFFLEQPSDVMMHCTAEHKQGEPYFLPFGFSYTVQGASYSIDFDDYQELNGQSGLLKPSKDVDVLIELAHVQEGVAFTLNYGMDSVEVVLVPQEAVASRK